MSRINRVPAGLQDLLGSQNFGDNPSELGQVVAPTLDMSRFYHPERRFVFTGISVVTATADSSLLTFTVPQDEIWFVTALGVRFSAINNVQHSGYFGWNITNTQNCNFPGKAMPIAGYKFSDDGARTSNQYVNLVQNLDYLPVLSNEGLNLILARSTVTAVNTISVDSFVRYLKVRV